MHELLPESPARRAQSMGRETAGQGAARARASF
jgi:hypothetical protein